MQRHAQAFFFILMGALLMVPNVQAKRAAPANLPPITSAYCEYTHQHSRKDDGFSMHILCTSNQTHKPLWDTLIYTVTFDTDMETDVQEIELASFDLKGDQLVATDERGTMYTLNAHDGSLVSPSTPKHY